MPSKTLLTVWGLFDFLLLLAGGLLIAFGIIAKSTDAIRNVVLNDSDLNFALVVGIFYAVTFVVSVGGIIQRNHITIGLAITNWLLIIDTIVTVLLGADLWFMTLREKANFARVWRQVTAAERIAVQNKLRCCGYTNNTLVETRGFCADRRNARNNGCDKKLLPLADAMLVDAFT
ncbi:phospholipid scramblase 1 [Serendipita sp. 398]|nr:phospholipid scramblase 1 [Serendipita sp. 398]